MTLAQIQSHYFRRTKTNATSFPAADQVIALNTANEFAHSLIRDLTDNYAPTAWTTSDLSTGTATPAFDALYHRIIPLHIEWEWSMENDKKSVAGFERQLQQVASDMQYYYAARNYRIFTVTIASPGVFLRKNHGLSSGDRVIFSTSSALPTGLTANTWYYVVTNGLDDDNFEVSATKDGTAINTSGSQSGTHWFASDTPHRMGTSYNPTGTASGRLSSGGNDSNR